MTVCENAVNPPWMIPYYKRNEAEAHRTFMAVAYLAGVEQSVGIPAPPGWERYQTIYRPIILAEDTECNPGPWRVQLAEDVRFMSPDTAAVNLPFTVSPSLIIRRQGNPDDFELMRPELLVFCPSEAQPVIHLAHTAKLGSFSMEGPLRRQARYLTWLAMVEAQVMQPT